MDNDTYANLQEFKRRVAIRDNHRSSEYLRDSSEMLFIVQHLSDTTRHVIHSVTDGLVESPSLFIIKLSQADVEKVIELLEVICE